MTIKDLEPIAIYDLNDLEAKAFKVALMWSYLIRKECPYYRHDKLSFSKNDPRKRSLFKYTYKLVTETQGLIPDNQYKLYILAQIRTLKQISDGNAHALIEPTCLVGPKAWKRWRLWKEEFDSQVEKSLVKSQAQPQIHSVFDVHKELIKTKNFFINSFSDTPSLIQVQKIVDTHHMRKWINQRKISPFYPILSPFVIQAMNGRPLEELGIETDVYLPAVNIEVRKFFQLEFPKEFAC